MGLCQTNDHATKTSILHQQIRTASEKEEPPATLMAASQDRCQILFRSRFNINIRSPANPQCRVLGQHFVAADHR
jgi:hypothetical protein